MNENWKTSCCGTAAGLREFPFFATALAVASCFAEAILQKHVALGSGFEIALALTQAVPFAIVLRYFAVRLSQSTGSTSAHNPQ